MKIMDKKRKEFDEKLIFFNESEKEINKFIEDKKNEIQKLNKEREDLFKEFNPKIDAISENITEINNLIKQQKNVLKEITEEQRKVKKEIELLEAEEVCTKTQKFNFEPIKLWLKTKKIKKVDFCRGIGISVQQLDSVIRNNKCPKIDVYLSICKRMNVGIDFFSNDNSPIKRTVVDLDPDLMASLSNVFFDNNQKIKLIKALNIQKEVLQELIN